MIITKSQPYTKEETEELRELLGALALDLHRVALGYQRGSYSMAKTFTKEALKRKKELQSKNLKPHLKKLLMQMDEILFQEEHQKLAEDALMYSTLFQNASLNLR